MPSTARSSVEPSLLRKLRAAANAAHVRNYARYSGFVVLAAIETSQGKVYGGANVEVANYSLTKHAEEAAVMAAIADGAPVQEAPPWLRTIYVVGGAPCGSCRQFLWEFAMPDARVVVDESLGTVKSDCELQELLPDAFGPTDLSVDKRPGTPPPGVKPLRRRRGGGAPTPRRASS